MKCILDGIHGTFLRADLPLLAAEGKQSWSFQNGVEVQHVHLGLGMSRWVFGGWGGKGRSYDCL